MRILSRPMFKYGGPIKEGVMHGMKNGGSMGNHEGPRRAALVGNPVFPKDSSGRAHHVWPYYLGAGIYAGARAALPWAARAGAKYIPRVIKGAKRMFGKTTPASVTKGGAPVGTSSGSYMPVTINPAKFNPNWLGSDPIVQGLGWAGKTLTSGPAKSIAGKALKFATAPSTLVGGLWFANGRWFNKKGEELDPDGTEVANAKTKAGGPPGGGSGMRGTGEWFEAEAQKKLAEKNKADRKAKIAKYMDTMGYDRAQKTAVGKALIDASAIVQAGTEEGGSLKHADWSKMINQAIQSTSKRLEKPEQIREAVGLMLTKSEIEKDLEDPQVKKLRALQIEQGEKALEEGFEKDMRDLFLSSKVAPDKKTVERYARYTADKYGHDFTKVTDEQLKNAAGKTEQEKLVNVVGDDGVYLIGDAIIKVTDGVPKLFG